jgi:predicted PurR-regulated permease PerM
MNPQVPPPQPWSRSILLRDRAVSIIAGGAVLAILYFARDVLVPIVLAIILALFLAPIVRKLRSAGLAQPLAVLSAVLILVLALIIVATTIGSQLVRMAASLPQYQETIHFKLKSIQEMTVDRLDVLSSDAGRAMNSFVEGHVNPAELPNAMRSDTDQAAKPVPVEIHNPARTSTQIIETIVTSVWGPIEMAGIVLVVLIFVLLDHQALRDRLIRIVGGDDLRATTNAINDAGDTLSRFFVSQFAVNAGVGAFIGVGLAILGLPHALLWGALTAVLRFVPYLGVWIAALGSTLFAAAVAPGWFLAIATVSCYVVIELIVAQLLEPQLYGHATGLSPLTVVIAAIFWSWLWGPIGLIVSTPMTLCVLVLGRHAKALSFLEVLLGDTPALTMSQRLYERALSGDSGEIIASARTFLKRRSLAEYCDSVLMPALWMARRDLDAATISEDQQLQLRRIIVTVIEALDAEKRKGSRRRPRTSALDEIAAGRQLRQQREQWAGRWQGPIEVAEGSVMLCVSLGSIADDLATELLVRIFRSQSIDARHLSLDDVGAATLPDTLVQSAAIVYIVSAFPDEHRNRGASVAGDIRRRFPHAQIVAVFLPGLSAEAPPPDSIIGLVNGATGSFAETLRLCVEKRGAASLR